MKSGGNLGVFILASINLIVKHYGFIDDYLQIYQTLGLSKVLALTAN